MMIAAAVAFLALGPAVERSPARAATVLVPPAAGGAPWTAQQVAALQGDVDRLLADPALRGAHVGLYAVATGSGAVLYEKAADEAFVPASTLKAVTGSVALDRLGPAFRFRTTLTGRIGPDGTVAGLVLHGGGDPLLCAADLRAAAAALAARGVRVVRGGIGIDASRFDAIPYGPGWMLDDLPYDYSAPVSGLMLDENVVRIAVAGGTAQGDAATVTMTPATSAVTLADDAVTGAPGSAASVDVRRDGATIAIAGSLAPGAHEELDAAVPDPLAYARDVFVRALGAARIALAPPAADAAAPPSADGSDVVLWTHDSAPLAGVLRWFWYRSDNLVGESLLKTLPAAAGSTGTTASGVALETAALRAMGVDPATLAIVDGSGLSRYDALTPRALVQIFQADWAGPYRADVLDALPVAGVRGTLAGQFVQPPLAGRIFAKSGSMTHVWNLAGYLATERHGAVTFALMTDDFVGDPDALRAVEARVLARIVGD